MARIAAARIGCLILAGALAGCGSDPSMTRENAQAEGMSAAATDGDFGRRPVHPGQNAAAGDVIPGQEVMLGPGGLAVGVIQLHPGQYYEFGRPQTDIVAMATHLRGPPTGSGRTEECDGGPVDYVEFGSLRVNFREGRFVGWDAAPGAPRLRDEWSFGIGSPREDIGDPADPDAPVRVARTTLGIEFESSGYRGLLSGEGPDAVVTDLWAGTVCLSR